MAAPKTTIWDLEPHTAAKHAILGRYLDAWFPILLKGGFPEITYIDGFAGPGRYSKGEDGSPIIALKSALRSSPSQNSKINFLFVELREDRANTLKEVIGEVIYPKGFSIKVEGGKQFEVTLGNFLVNLSSQSRRIPPIFAFVDPFGWGVSFNSVARILGNPNSEVLVTFMYEEINRFLDHPQQEENFNSFFGTSEWKQIISIKDPKTRNDSLRNLYLKQLKNVAKAKYVWPFQMKNERGLTDYYLFYATNSLIGLSRMKSSMWKIDPAGDFIFSDAISPIQGVLFQREPQLDVLERQILETFRGKEVTIGELEEFTLAETPFRETHYKMVLKNLEYSIPPKIQVVSPPLKRRRSSYADKNMKIRF